MLHALSGCIGGCDEILKQLVEICGTGSRNTSTTPGVYQILIWYNWTRAKKKSILPPHGLGWVQFTTLTFDLHHITPNGVTLLNTDMEKLIFPKSLPNLTNKEQ